MKANTEMARMAFRYCGGLAALFILISGKLSAQQIQTRAEEKPALQVSYHDHDSKYLVFKVAVTNAGSKKSVLKVSDSKETLYSEVFSDDLYSRTIKLPKSEFETGAFEFRLSSGKEVIRRSFEVKRTTREISEVLVTELK